MTISQTFPRYYLKKLNNGDLTKRSPYTIEKEIIETLGGKPRELKYKGDSYNRIKISMELQAVALQKLNTIADTLSLPRPIRA